MFYKYLSFFAFCLLAFSACNLEKEIELELPDYETQTVVEGYLQPGKPFTLLLTESDPFFASFGTLDNQYLENLLKDDAEVTISYNGQDISLQNGLFFNLQTGKLYNYQAQNFFVPEDYEEEFTLNIRTADGEIITGKTRIAPPTAIDSLVIEFQENNDTLARVLTYASDDVDNVNFYRRIFLTGSDRFVDQDFAVDDELLDSETFVFGTGYDFAPGDTVASVFSQINEDYYRFINSVQNAVDSNGNPFGQPSVIISNVEGEGNPIGIFTGFVQDEVIRIVPE